MLSSVVASSTVCLQLIGGAEGRVVLISADAAPTSLSYLSFDLTFFCYFFIIYLALLIGIFAFFASTPTFVLILPLF